MKKKLMALLLVAGMAVFALSGCGNSGDSEGNMSSLDDEVITDYYYGIQAYGLDEAYLVITSTDENGETIVEETGSYGWFGTPDQTIGEMMEEWGVVSIEPKCEGFDFLGWQAYEMISYVDENGFESVDESVLYEGKVFTTEEMMSQELFDADIYFYTVWDLVCGGCEEHKVCQVYYIDDDRYFVCDDCYDEFATGMGLVDDTTDASDANTDTSDKADTTNKTDKADTSNKTDTTDTPEADDSFLYQLCSGCETEKRCGTYVVDGVDYVVCDDCYEEFATGMGIEVELKVCGGCEQEKECSTVTIDGVQYVVCDDCYDEFATGMGIN